MSRRPHVYLGGPWNERAIELTNEKARHLRKVLRLSDGAPLTYTDGAGFRGTGTLASGSIIRGEEVAVARPSTARLAVAPPRSADRARYVVEKLAELGVETLTWLETDRSVATAPKPARCEAWSVAALEQSGGAWRMRISEGELSAFGDVVLADQAGDPWPPDDWSAGTVIAIGPEGGWSERERVGRRLVSLADTVLRVETAAAVAAVLAK